ncbi:MAG TPA: hypothetical protein VNO14_06360 [Blastocatellia bacterium]|nr:hypothetical protein [Blastocatellia bacterium]
MNQQIGFLKEYALIDRLIEARLEKIESLKTMLRNNVKSVDEESAILRELSGEITLLRELRQMQALDAARPRAYKARSAGI